MAPILEEISTAVYAYVKLLPLTSNAIAPPPPGNVSQPVPADPSQHAVVWIKLKLYNLADFNNVQISITVVDDWQFDGWGGKK